VFRGRLGSRGLEGGEMNKKIVVVPAVAFAMYAMSHQPAQSADAVSKGWSQLTSGSGSVMNGFFTFVGRL
jgi:hypothetical protein